MDRYDSAWHFLFVLHFKQTLFLVDAERIIGMTPNECANLIPPERVEFFKFERAISVLLALKIVHSQLFRLLFYRDQPYMALIESPREDPVTSLIVLIDILELCAVVISLFFLLAHVVDADYVSVADEHVHGEVHNR